MSARDPLQPFPGGFPLASRGLVLKAWISLCPEGGRGCTLIVAAELKVGVGRWEWV